jgi:hypothetical protein
MEALWYFSGQNGVFSVPDQQIIINHQGDLLPFAASCALDLESVELFTDLCREHQAIVLVADQGRFDEAQLKLIPPELPCIAMLSPYTTEASRKQIDTFGVDAFVFSGMNHVDFAAVMKKAVEDKQATNALQEEIKKYSDIAFTAMNSASEMGVVALFAEAVQRSTELPMLAQAAIDCIDDLGMEAVVQFCFDNKTLLYPTSIPASYKKLLESTLAATARIVSHGRFLVFSFNHVQLLITNAPTHDSDRYGRMRDVLAHLVSITESRAKTLQVNQMLKEQQENARMVMMLLEMASRDNRNSVKTIMTDLSLSLRHMAVGLDLTLAQETALTALADAALESLESLQEATVAVEEHFRSLLAQMDLVATLLHTKTDSPDIHASSAKVELF